MNIPAGGIYQIGAYFQNFRVIPAHSAMRRARGRWALFDKPLTTVILASFPAPGIPGGVKST